MAPGVLRVGLLLVAVSVGVMCVGQILELQGSWKAEFKDSLGVGTASLLLTASDTKDLAGSYRTNLGGEGTVAVRPQGNGYKFILTQATKDCTGSFIGEFGFADGKITGTYSGTDCKGWHDNGVISMIRDNNSRSSKSLGQGKEWSKDSAEYQAYVGAGQHQDLNAKISGLEAFLTQYPNSVMKENALQLLMGTYQQAGKQAKVIDAANRLLAVNPDNTRALVLLAYNERAAQKWTDAKQHAERGMQALANMPKADGVSDADFTKQKGQLSALLNSVAGFSALQLKDYAAAQKYLRPAVEADPNNVENVYPLALAYLTATPSDDVNGLFFIARAANLVSDPKGKDSIVKFGDNRYVKYHGSEQGWDELLAQTKTTSLPPAGFIIAQHVPPTPAEPAAVANQSQQYAGTSESQLSIRVLQTEQVPYSVQYGGGGSTTNCSINGSTYTTGSATSIGNFTYGNANSNTDLSMHCNTQENPPMQWRHVLNTMLVVASNGNAYIIACDAAWRWSKCRGLVTGDIFQAKMTSKGLVVRYVLKDKAKEGTYSILRGKVLGQ